MRDPERIQRILRKLEIAWNKYPDWRFAQLVSNIYGHDVQDIFYLEDDETEGKLDCWLEMVGVSIDP